MKTFSRLLIVIFTCILFTRCNNGSENKNTSTSKSGITKQDWGEYDGKQVYLFTLQNDNGTIVTISSYGGTVTSFITPDKNGKNQVS